MKAIIAVMGVGLGLVGTGFGDPDRVVADQGRPAVVEPGKKLPQPDRGLYVFPPEFRREKGTDEAFRAKARDEVIQERLERMLDAARKEQEKLEAPVEFPKLDEAQMQRLIRDAREPHGWMPKPWTIGVIIAPENEERIVVSGLINGGPAEQSGIKRGDVLLKVNGIRLRDLEMLRDLLQVIRDQEVTLELQRGEEKMSVEIAARESRVPRGLPPKEEPPEVLIPKVEAEPKKTDETDEILEELRGMRELMKEMLQEMKKQQPPRRTRSVPAPRR